MLKKPHVTNIWYLQCLRIPHIKQRPNCDQTSSKLLQNFESKFRRNFDETARVNPNLMIGVMLFSQKGFLQTVGCLMISSVNLIETSLQPLGIISVVKRLEKTLRVP